MSTEHQLLKMILTEEPEIWTNSARNVLELFYRELEISFCPSNQAFVKVDNEDVYSHHGWKRITKEQFLEEVEDARAS